MARDGRREDVWLVRSFRILSHRKVVAAFLSRTCSVRRPVNSRALASKPLESHPDVSRCCEISEQRPFSGSTQLGLSFP